jgi:cysteine-rich repeat protein
MRRRERSVVAFLALTLSLAVISCGGGGGPAFENCGNGSLDAGEECDDGNLVDQDACLGTCERNVCGDTFLNVGVEECDDTAFGEASCATLGFAGGTLACTASCTFDTSGCTGSDGQSTPTPSAQGTPSPGSVSPTPSTASPVATSTPSSGTICRAGDQLVAKASVDKPYGGISLRLGYPPAANVPGSGSNAQSVKDRVVFAQPGGLTAVNDQDESGDGVDDTLFVSSVGSSDNAAGLYVTVTFDCVAGQAPPSSSAFTCTVVSASTSGGVSIPDEHCALTVTGP